MPPRKTTTTTSRKNKWNTWDNWQGASWKPGKHTNWPTTTYPCNSPKFKPIKDECQWRMGSYRNVYAQFTGTGMKTYFSPTTANKWVRYVNNGVQVYKFTNKDFTKHFGAKWSYATPTTTRKYLTQKFGSSIKDVTRGKGNCWLVAASKTPSSHPFNNYRWWK